MQESLLNRKWPFRRRYDIYSQQLGPENPINSTFKEEITMKKKFPCVLSALLLTLSITAATMAGDIQGVGLPCTNPGDIQGVGCSGPSASDPQIQESDDLSIETAFIVELLTALF
jgi:hypothetical protein